MITWGEKIFTANHPLTALQNNNGTRVLQICSTDRAFAARLEDGHLAQGRSAILGLGVTSWIPKIWGFRSCCAWLSVGKTTISIESYWIYLTELTWHWSIFPVGMDWSRYCFPDRCGWFASCMLGENRSFPNMSTEGHESSCAEKVLRSRIHCEAPFVKVSNDNHFDQLCDCKAGWWLGGALSMVAVAPRRNLANWVSCRMAVSHNGCLFPCAGNCLDFWSVRLL